MQLQSSDYEFFPMNQALSLQQKKEESLDSQLDHVERKIDSLLNKQRKQVAHRIYSLADSQVLYSSERLPHYAGCAL